MLHLSLDRDGAESTTIASDNNVVKTRYTYLNALHVHLGNYATSQSHFGVHESLVFGMVCSYTGALFCLPFQNFIMY